MNNNYLKDIIGLEPIKEQIKFYLDIYHSTGYFKNLLLVGGKGTGKTKLARSIGIELVNSKTGKPRDFYEINCETLGSLKELFCEIGEAILNNEEATFYFDECEELDKGISRELLTILEVKPDQKSTKYKLDNIDYHFCFDKVSFIFSTTNPEKMLEPLVDRLKVVSIPAYGQTELQGIIDFYLKNVNVSDNILENLSTVVRGNPRACVKLTEDIRGYLKTKNKDTLTLDDCKSIYRSLSIYPLGLTYSEVQILHILKDNPNCSLTRLSAVTGKNVHMLRRFEETFLQKQGLIEIKQATGRNLTGLGANYLRELKKDGVNLDIK